MSFRLSPHSMHCLSFFMCIFSSIKQKISSHLRSLIIYDDAHFLNGLKIVFFLSLFFTQIFLITCSIYSFLSYQHHRQQHINEKCFFFKFFNFAYFLFFYYSTGLIVITRDNKKATRKVPSAKQTTKA